MSESLQPLTIDTERVISRHEMQASAYAEHAKTPGRKSKSDHPFPVALGKRKPAMTVAQWADAHDIKRTTVNSWFLEGKAARRIPRSVAREIQREFKVPLSAWTNGIKED